MSGKMFDKKDIAKAPPNVNTAPSDLEIGNADDVMSKYDLEYTFRSLKGIWPKLITIICVVWSLGQLYTAVFGTFPSTLQRAPHVGFALTLIYMLYPISKKKKTDYIPWYDFILIGLSIAVTL